MMPEQEKVMTKIQKWLKDMEIDYNFSLKEDMTVVMNFKDLDGNEYRIEPVSGGFNLYGCGLARVQTSQSEVVKALSFIDYKFGADMERLNEEREKEARFKRIQKALDDVKRESFYFGGNGDGIIDDYELIIETNDLGMKRAYVKNLNKRDFMPNIAIEDFRDYNKDGEQELPDVVIRLSGTNALTALDAMALVREIDKAIESVVYFQEIIKREWAKIERIEIVW